MDLAVNFVLPFFSVTAILIDILPECRWRSRYRHEWPDQPSWKDVAADFAVGFCLPLKGHLLEEHRSRDPPLELRPSRSLEHEKAALPPNLPVPRRNVAAGHFYDDLTIGINVSNPANGS